MFPCKSSSWLGRRIWSALVVFSVGCGAALAWLLCTEACAQTPTPLDNAIQSHEAAEASICSLYGCNGGPGASAPRIGYDPCFLAQNAMRPCTSDQRHVSKPAGVDPNLVGTWELPFKDGPWVLNIRRDGTYKFHSEARDGAPPHAGAFSANQGHWSLKATTGYTDAGNYLFQSPNIWIATGQLGAAAWLRPALVQNAIRPCTSDQRQVSKPVGVDPDLVAIWKLPLKRGSWVWEILRDGTYKFHSEALDGAPSHAGTFSAHDGRWSLKAEDGYADAGMYLFQAPNILIATGHLGAAAWLNSASAKCSAVR